MSRSLPTESRRPASRRAFQTLLALGVALLWTAPAAALTMDRTGFFDSPTVVDFETGFPAGGFSSQTIGDATFSSTGGGDTLALMNLGSGQGLVEITGSMTIELASAATRVGFDYMAGTPVYLEAYDAAGNLLNSGDIGGVTGMGFLGFESATSIASVVIHDTGLTFRVDNFTYDRSVTPTPEPTAAVLFSVGLLTAISAIRRRPGAR